MAGETVSLSFPGTAITAAGKKIQYKGYAQDCCSLNKFFLEYLQSFNISTALVSQISPETLELTATSEYAFGVEISNFYSPKAGAFFGKNTWSPYSIPVPEYYLIAQPAQKLSNYQLIGMDLCPADEVKAINQIASRINVILRSFFERREKLLISFRCTFGKTEDKILLTGEFSPAGTLVLPAAELAVSVERFNFSTAKELKSHTAFLLQECRI